MSVKLYEEAKKRAAAASTAEIKRGVGISLGVYGAGLDGADSAAADAELMADGTVTIYDCWQDHGQGADMGTLGTAHEALRPLGITPDKIRLVMNDTRVAPNTGPAGGSRSQVVGGQAIINACEQLVKAMTKPGGGFRSYDEMVAEKLPLRLQPSGGGRIGGDAVLSACAAFAVSPSVMRLRGACRGHGLRANRRGPWRRRGWAGRGAFWRRGGR